MSIAELLSGSTALWSPNPKPDEAARDMLISSVVSVLDENACWGFEDEALRVKWPEKKSLSSGTSVYTAL
jgi:uncharacterized protein YneR